MSAEDMGILPGQEAAGRLDTAPHTVFFALRQMVDDFGLTPGELLAELRSGRLVAVGTPCDRQRFRDVLVRADHFLDWMRRSPRGLRLAADICAGKLEFQKRGRKP